MFSKGFRTVTSTVVSCFNQRERCRSISCNGMVRVITDFNSNRKFTSNIIRNDGDNNNNSSRIKYGTIEPQNSGRITVLLKKRLQERRSLSLLPGLSYSMYGILQSRYYSNSCRCWSYNNHGDYNSNSGSSFSNKQTGTVIEFDDNLGYGYIAPDDRSETGPKDVFVHFSKIVADGGYRTLHRGERVEFEYFINARGPTAVNVTGLNGQPVRSRVGGTRIEDNDENNDKVQEGHPTRKENQNQFTSWISYGNVVSYNTSIGYGFIKPVDGTKDVYVYHTSIRMDSNRKELKIGQRVYFEAFLNDRGPTAKVVRIMDEDENDHYNDDKQLSSSSPSVTPKTNYGKIIMLKNNAQGWGFIRPDNKTHDIYFHRSVLADGIHYEMLQKGQHVQYTAILDKRGLTATSVSFVPEE